MTSLLINFDDLDPSDRADLEDLATSLVEPADHRSEWEGRWSKSFRALDALRSLINEFAAHDVLRWADGTPAGATASFDSDGEQTDTEFINISVLLPTKNTTGRFGAFVMFLVSDIDDLLPASERTAATCAEAVARALGDAVADACTAA
ncbi:hypothetical protein C3V38_16115 (plasmid) [Dietzia sp. oral taxon 368]|jgi:hypothetical protein|uniref:hypothetical protein n=1 Tax=Dietzia sp. oral taxon 368 TaxID=712270 RepID=UPI000D093497|nr:hypothetical protein [Dietzia sp. oral taxon 368]AVM66082.1 hypothetical protein C3V38_16115 [Dietzia sp. oral taxon 368]